MNKITITIFIIITVITLSSCQKTNYSTSNIKTQILGHRGYGIKDYNDTIMDNTIPAILKAIHITDGVEVDIQMSLDKTVWLYHDTELFDTNSNSYCIPKLSDIEVLKLLSNTHPKTKFNTLKELFEYFKNNNINCLISLDIKPFYNVRCFISKADKDKYMYEIGENIISLAKKYDLENQILIESDIKSLLDYFKDNSNIKTFLLGFTEFNKHIKIAKKKKYTGISHHYKDSEINKESVSYAQNKGLQIQLWTPNSITDLKSVLSLHPNFIQTDNINYFKDSL